MQHIARSDDSGLECRMAIMRIMHTLQGFSGLPEDRFVNTFYALGAVTVDATSGAAIKDALVSFYGDASLGQYMSQSAAGIGRTVKIYDMADAKPRVPKYEFTDTAIPWGNLGANYLPNEVAMCMSFEAVQVSGLPQARRRGRVYLGPFSVNALAPADATQQSRPKLALRASIKTWAATMAAAWQSAGYNWAVYSPTANDAHEVVRVWADDAWDTQRRRGVSPLSVESGPI